MRPVLHGDLICAAAAVARAALGRRYDSALDLVRRADAADRYCKRFGRTHPGWGNGTLMAAALAGGPQATDPCGAEDRIEALLLVLEALRAHRAHPVAQDTQRVAEGSNSSRLYGIRSPQSLQ